MLLESYDGQPIWHFGRREPEVMANLELMQFTGLLDKNGREIYEGDIIKRGEFGASRVEFSEGAFVLAEGEYEPLSHYMRDAWEVIGNIYENEG